MLCILFQEIKLDEFKGNKQGIQDKISEFTGTCAPFKAGTIQSDGTANLARALDHVRTSTLLVS